MLVCPQCQFDNPNNNASCEQCGASLTHKNCPECGATIGYDAETCPECGADTALYWWVVINYLDISQIEANKSLNSLPETTANKPDANLSEQESLEKLSQYFLNRGIPYPYLDLGERYRIVTDTNVSIASNIAENTSFLGKVIDCQPLQKSFLKALLEEQVDLFSETAKESEIDQKIKTVLLQEISIPEGAIPYLTLSKFAPVIPELHEAWSDGYQEIILLSNRSDWQLLSEQFKQQALSALQIIHWFNEMLRLWQPLTELGYSQSLLIEDNLRVDEDQIFGLRQLNVDPPDFQPSLSDLAQIWQKLLSAKAGTYLESLEKLLQEVTNGKIQTVKELQLQLEKLADAEQTPAPQQSPDKFSDIPNLCLEESLLQAENSLETGLQDEILLEDVGEESTAILPMQLLSLTDAGCTDVGRQRRHNEDYFGMDLEIRKQVNNNEQKVQARGIYIVCDGMGGHASGEVASAMAVKTLQEYFATNWTDDLPDQNTITEAIHLANQTIFQVNQKKDSYGSGRMGTTLVLALVQNTKVVIAHVGDSRVYRVNRKWGLEQLTVDHEVGQKAIQEGVAPHIAYSRPDAYQLTQALGPHDNIYVKPGIQYLELHEDTLLLLCSDGLSDNDFLEDNWQTCLTPLISSNTNLDEGVQKLINLANRKNGHDNITAILVRIKVQPRLESSF